MDLASVVRKTVPLGIALGAAGALAFCVSDVDASITRELFDTQNLNFIFRKILKPDYLKAGVGMAAAVLGNCKKPALAVIGAGTSLYTAIGVLEGASMEDLHWADIPDDAARGFLVSGGSYYIGRLSRLFTKY